MGNADYRVEFVDPGELDAAAWDAHVIATSGNPTQLTAFGELGGAMRQPVYAQLRQGSDVLLRWLFYRAGLPGLTYLDIRSEPTSEDPALVEAVLRAAVRRFRPFRIRFYDIVYNRWHSAEALKSLGFDTIKPYGTVSLDLTHSLDTLRAAMHKKQRGSVNRGHRDGLVLTEQSDAAGVDRLYPVIAQTMARAEAGIPRQDYVREHARRLCPPGYGRLFFATRAGIDYGAAFELITPKLALDWLGGTRNDAPASTGNFLQWSIIERLQQDGVAAYDLGGVDTQASDDSKGARILRSKQRYGGQLTEHFGAIRDRGRLRAALYDAIMRLRQR